jgi:methylated-DNA-[protein]-cysteine S-methyltransferase
MSERGFALFDTAIGRCAVAWSAAGLLATQLPEADGGRSRRRIAVRVPDCAEAEPPLWVQAAIEKIATHIAGGSVDYRDVPLDRNGIGTWECAVYDAALAIPRGETRTYGALARALGRPEAAQAVGQAIGRNPWPIVVPCHRILAADGRTGGFSAPGGVSTKLKLLEVEGALGPASLPLFAQTQG